MKNVKTVFSITIIVILCLNLTVLVSNSKNLSVDSNVSVKAVEIAGSESGFFCDTKSSTTDIMGIACGSYRVIETRIDERCEGNFLTCNAGYIILTYDCFGQTSIFAEDHWTGWCL
jgi:hypothetical protein